MKAIKKILYLQLSTAGPNDWSVGGPVRIIDDYARYITSLNNTILLVSSLTSNTLVCSDYPYKTKIFPSIKIFKKFMINVPSPSFIANLITLINSNDKVVIHISTYRGALSVLAILLARYYRKKTKIVWSIFGQLHYKKSTLRALYDLFFQNIFFNSISIAISQNLSEYNLSCTYLNKHTKLALIPLGSQDAEIFVKNHKIDSNSYEVHKIKARRSIEKYLPVALNAEQPLIVNVSRFFWAKGHIRLLETFSHSLECKNFRSKKPILILIGCDQGHLSNINLKIQELKLSHCVFVLEDITKNRFSFYLAADMFAAFPLIEEQSMLASIEALSCGCRIVVSKEASLKVTESMNISESVDELDYNLESSSFFIGNYFCSTNRSQARLSMNLYNQYFHSRIINDSLYSTILK